MGLRCPPAGCFRMSHGMSLRSAAGTLVRTARPACPGRLVYPADRKLANDYYSGLTTFDPGMLREGKS